MKKILLILLLASLYCQLAVTGPATRPIEEPTPSKSMTIRIDLPSAEELKKRLDSRFNYFVEKTNIDKTLGNTTKYPAGIVIAVECALYDFNEYLKDPFIALTMQMSKTDIVERILQDHPQAIEQLKKDGYLPRES